MPSQKDCRGQPDVPDAGVLGRVCGFHRTWRACPDLCLLHLCAVCHCALRAVCGHHHLLGCDSAHGLACDGVPSGRCNKPLSRPARLRPVLRQILPRIQPQLRRRVRPRGPHDRQRLRVSSRHRWTHAIGSPAPPGLGCVAPGRRVISASCLHGTPRQRPVIA